MPIKYQMLGGGGGKRTDVVIKTLPNATVTLSSTEYTKTLQADGSGNVIFKGLKSGIYTAVSMSSNGTTYQKNISVLDQQEESLLERKMIKDLPIGSKIKFSSGKKFFLTGKSIKSKNNISEGNHEPNSATFMAEYVYGKSTWRPNVQYRDTEMCKTIMPSFYNELSQKEKDAMIEREFRTWNQGINGEIYTLKSYFWIPSATELDYDVSIEYPRYDEEGAFIFETNPPTYKITQEDGGISDFFTRTFYLGGTTHKEKIVINKGATHNISQYDNKLPLTIGIVPICDLSGFTWVNKDNDGYWIIE